MGLVRELLHGSPEAVMHTAVDASWIPYLLVMPTLMLVADRLAVAVPFYRRLLEASQPGRWEGLDGLRGMLATGVFFCHSVVTYQYHQHGVWQRPASPFYSALGEFSVTLFFMITGFLFWSRAIARQGRIAPVALYWSRFWRIAPLYALSASLICLIVALKSHLRLREPLPLLGQQLWHVWSLGALGFAALNGISLAPINAAVTWTLKYEWKFYLVLPALAWLARPRRYVGLLLFLLVAYERSWRPDVIYLLNFAAGMGVAHLVAGGDPVRRVATRRWWNLVPLFAVLEISLGIPAYSLAGTACGAIVLLSVVSGCDFGGLLRLRAMQMLGLVSYSIYLLHGLILCLGLSVVRQASPVEKMDSPLYWLVIAVLGSLTVVLSAVTYRWLEHPFLRMSLPRPVGRRKERQDPSSAVASVCSR
jgi:peptidoglycan/LPS O-acetylase OafA/YrhL